MSDSESFWDRDIPMVVVGPVLIIFLGLAGAMLGQSMPQPAPHVPTAAEQAQEAQIEAKVRADKRARDAAWQECTDQVNSGGNSDCLLTQMGIPTDRQEDRLIRAQRVDEARKYFGR